MSEYVDFHYMPLEGKITGEQVLKQTEDAINDLGNKVYNLDIDESRIDEAIENSEQAINTANSALSAVTTDRSVWKNTVAEMKATDIDLGVTAATRGKMVFNDGNGAFYGVRSEKSGDVDSDDTVFLNNGNVAERIQSMNIIAKGNNIIFVAHVAELIDSDALIGNVYGTTGYYSANDGGAGLYSIRPKGSSDVDDGGSIIFLDNGNVAELITDNGEVNVNQFGAKGDGTTDDTTAIQNAINKFTTIRFGKKTYRITSAISVPSFRNIIGTVLGNTVIELDGHGDALNLNDVQCVTLQDFTLTMEGTGVSGDVGINSSNVRRYTILRVQTNNFYEGFKFDRCWSLRVGNCIAYAHEYGFSFNRTTTSNGTSLFMHNCYAKNCKYGHYVRYMTYSSLISCSCDFASETAYYVERCNISLISCGCELPKVALDIEDYGSMVTVQNFFAYHPSSTDYAVKIYSPTRNDVTRTHVYITGIYIAYENDVAKNLKSFVSNSSDAYLYMQAVRLEPATKTDGTNPAHVVAPPWLLTYNSAHIASIQCPIYSALPSKAFFYNGQVIYRLPSLYSEADKSLGWVCVRGGIYCNASYDSSVSYNVGDSVIGGSSRVFDCIQANDSSNPHDTTDTDYWKDTGFVYAKLAKLPDRTSNIN